MSSEACVGLELYTRLWLWVAGWSVCGPAEWYAGWGVALFGGWDAMLRGGDGRGAGIRLETVGFDMGG